jgi:4-amino-4-deoxy-L-arabinose transferase-like glycosyltransferase
MFWAGFLIRVLYITVVHTYRIRPEEDHLQFGWEMGRIARALATGFGYADPFTAHSGPTAWSPPLYPLLIAAVFKLFGVYTAASAWVLLTINSIFSAATSSVIYEISMRCFPRTGRSKKIALWSGWLWALYPAAMQFAVRWIWDMCITAFLFSKILVIALRVRGIGEDPRTPETSTTTRWAAFGILSGLVILLNSTLLLFLPICGLWMLLPTLRTKPAPTLLRGALACILVLACLAPWMIRNYTVFHAFIPMRGNLGAELHQSTLAEHQGFPWGATIPICEVCPVFQQYRQMGEFAYVQKENQLAKQEIRAHKMRFIDYSLKRFYFFWVSVPKPAEKGVLLEAAREANYFFLSLASLLGLALALKQRIPGAVLFAWAFALVPLTYYFITVQARFRHPLEPIMTILTVYLFQSATTRKKRMIEEI